MRISVDMRKRTTGLRLCCMTAGLSLLLAGCFLRDLSIPPPPEEVSDTVRVTVTLTRPEAADVSVSAQQLLDENGMAAPTGVMLQDTKTVQATLGEARSVEFDFPVGSTKIKSGTWAFSTHATSPPGTDSNPWDTKCTVILRKGGVNRVDAVENMSTCTGGFVVFTPHDVGIDALTVEPPSPPSLNVGDTATIKFNAMNNGPDPEVPFNVTVTVLDPAGVPIMTQVASVPALPSGAGQVIPVPTDPPVTWNTTGLSPGTYKVKALITSPVPGDPQSSNDKDDAIVELRPGDFDKDGVPDDVDNCPRVSNANQDNCDLDPVDGDPNGPEGKLGNACKAPKIKTVTPDLCMSRAGDTITVKGFGFANIQANSIHVGPVTASGIVGTTTACKLQFTNPTTNPTGVLTIDTMPQLQTPLCCTTPMISSFLPTIGTAATSAGAAGTKIWVLGCGLTGVTALLTAYPGGTPQIQLASPTIDPTGMLLSFTIPNVPTGLYWIELRKASTATDVKSQSRLLVQ